MNPRNTGGGPKYPFRLLCHSAPSRANRACTPECQSVPHVKSISSKVTHLHMPRSAAPGHIISLFYHTVPPRLLNLRKFPAGERNRRLNPGARFAACSVSQGSRNRRPPRQGSSQAPPASSSANEIEIAPELTRFSGSVFKRLPELDALLGDRPI